MANPFPANFEGLDGSRRLTGQVNFTDPANQPGGGPAGSVVPVAGASASLDSSSYPDAITGSGNYVTLILPTEDAFLAVAQTGDAFPRVLFSSSPTGYGLMLDDGAHDPASNHGASLSIFAGSLWINPGTGRTVQMAQPLAVQAATTPQQAPQLLQVSPYTATTSGALSTVQLVSTTAVQVAFTDVETLTPVTFNPTAGAAATCKVELSADDVTYSTLGIETVPLGVALDGTVHIVKVRCPSGWFLKLTTTNAVLGLTTYY